MLKTSAPDTAILLVSDLPSLRAQLSEWLYSPRTAVLPAETTDSVFRRARERNYDLVVWDATPRTVGMEGVGLAVTDEFSETPTIILCPPEAPQLKSPDTREGVAVLPVEPLTRADFLAAVSRLMPTLRGQFA